MKVKKILLILFLTVLFVVKVFSQQRIIINIKLQKLFLLENNDTIYKYDISSSKVGIGNKENSNMTPLGKHQLAVKIGDNAPLGAIFESRKLTGKMAKIYYDNTDSDEDLVLTRIMRLKGLEAGINLGGNVDSYNRYIYIHGTNEEGLIGTPASHGCIRMKNTDVIELYNSVKVGVPINIISF